MNGAKLSAPRQSAPKQTILYERLSQDDKQVGDSNSIKNQRRLLEEYALQHGLVPYTHISDDGYTGVNYERPGWQELIGKVEANEVCALVIKDSSRMGRNYLRTGLYREYFREKGVRIISVNDGTDTADGEDDFTPFREIMAEWFARDISRKIKSVFHKKGRDGKPMSNSPMYGFRKDPQSKDAWIIDEEAAAIVRRIFHMTVGGWGPYAIARQLLDERVERPSHYLHRAGIRKISGSSAHELAYSWRGHVVSKMLAQREYMGDLVNFKTYKPSFKSKRVLINAPEDRLVFEGALPAIVPRETWELAQKLRKTKRVPREHDPANPLTGLLFCADCGGKMTAHHRNRQDGSADYYECSTNRNGAKAFRDRCSLHYVNSAAVREALHGAIRAVSAHAMEQNAGFADGVIEALARRREDLSSALGRQIAKDGRRVAELDLIFQKTYEDYATGRLNGSRFKQLSGSYECEQSELKAQIAAARAKLDSLDKGGADNCGADDGAHGDGAHGDGGDGGDSSVMHGYGIKELVGRYTEFRELTTPMLNELISKVLVHQADKSSGKRIQRIDVYLSIADAAGIPDPGVPALSAPPTP